MKSEIKKMQNYTIVMGKKAVVKKFKEQGKISPEKFNRAELEKAALCLFDLWKSLQGFVHDSFIEMLKSFCGRSSYCLVKQIIEVVGTIDLILSPDTEYGYLENSISQRKNNPI